MIILKTRSGHGHSDLRMVFDSPPSLDAFTHHIWNSYLKEYKWYAPDTIILKTRSECQGQGDRKMISDTPPSQDACTYQIWDSFLKEYRYYAPDAKWDGWTDL